MKKNNITVVVSGCANTGKSTISKIILDVLREKGFDVEVAPEMLMDYGGSELKFHHTMQQHEDKRLKAVNEKSRITVTEQQLRREANVEKT
ncbi:unnamed protein product [marine sediment metagenome]|uniref:Uncharacterized protein n=1 Tax=marine sediment metagenome TaxID=412755 RepID=X0WYW9_9ZZZZ